VTDAPMLPLAGVKLVIVGAAACAAPAKTSVATRASRAAPAFRTLLLLTFTSMFLPGLSGRRWRARVPGGGIRIQRNHAAGSGRVARKGDLTPPGTIRRSAPRVPHRSRST